MVVVSVSDFDDEILVVMYFVNVGVVVMCGDVKVVFDLFFKISFG